AVIAVSVVLIIQAFVFGDGGITAIGANCFNMAIVMPFVAFWTFNLLKGSSQKGARVTTAAFLSGYVGLTAAALCAAFMFGIQPVIASGPDGRPLYAPYPLSIAIPAVAMGHLLLFSIVEGVMTVMIMKYFLKHKSMLIYSMREVDHEEV
ncbi:MAG TPA: energy-coupling factor ABC transporter permease, partial [Syntrophales bacterium]|nr:energy-coupling factor ABC transporter permease [Syntrophales bacterium]